MSVIRMAIVVIVLVTTLAFLQYRLWFEKGGIRDLVRAKQKIAKQQAENIALKKQNDELLFQVQRIQNSKEAAEARARSELGMVKKGETFYQVVK